MGLLATVWIQRPLKPRASRPVAGSLSVRELADAVFRPRVPPVLDVDSGELEAILDRLRPPSGMNASGLLHAIHLFGDGLMVPAGSLREGQSTVLGALLDDRRAIEIFDGAHTLVATRYGVRSPLHETGMLGSNQTGAQAHPGQFLAMLASLGIEPSSPVTLDDGSCRPVSAVRDDIMANFSMDGEIAWIAIALAVYAEKPTWTNKLGRTFSFDELADELMARDPYQASCGGAHLLMAPTVLSKVDSLKPVLSGPTRHRVDRDLAERVERVKAAQLSDGSWGPRWSAETPADKTRASRSTPEARLNALIVTGHLLEWLMLVPEPGRPGAEVFQRAGKWLANALSAQPRDEQWILKHYCPLVHAARSLRILARTTTVPRGQSVSSGVRTKTFDVLRSQGDRP